MKRFTACIAAIFGTAAIICSCTKAEESGGEIKGEEYKISFAVDGHAYDYELSDDGGVKVDWAERRRYIRRNERRLLGEQLLYRGGEA